MTLSLFLRDSFKACKWGTPNSWKRKCCFIWTQMPAAEADRPGKVFVGGLASDIDEAVLEKYFSHYGRLTEGKYNISVNF